MNITFRDEFGYVNVQVDEYGISFCDSYAHFSAEEMEYKVDINNIMKIED